MKQTAVYRLKPNFEQEKHLHNLSSIATKLYNTDNYQRREQWENTGKIPSWYSQKKLLKTNHWYKLLPSQSAQEICHNLQGAYNSWFALRKKGDKDAKPPRFRKKEMLSPISFYQQFKVMDNKLRLSMSMKYRKEHNFNFIELDFDKWKSMDGIPKFCQIIFKKGKWYAHIVYEMPEPTPRLNDKVMAVDLGIINTAVSVDTDGNSKIYSGKQILSIQRYFNKKIAQSQSSLTKQYSKRKSSNALRRLYVKKTRQIRQALHTHSKSIIKDCINKGIKTLVAGDITDIRKGKHWNKKSSQKLHSWSFSKFTQMLEYKAIQVGIRFVRVNEKYTSQDCSICGDRRKSNRKHRGLYLCKKCGSMINADVNGATNILKKYLQDFLSRSSCIVAMPSVARLKCIVPS